MDECKFTAVFYNKSPLTINITSEEKFVELCETSPTKWAHLMNKETGEVVYSWSAESTSWNNN